jgi:hypothetical protein
MLSPAPAKRSEIIFKKRMSDFSASSDSSSLYYKGVTIVIYDCNNSGLYYKCVSVTMKLIHLATLKC